MVARVIVPVAHQGVVGHATPEFLQVLLAGLSVGNPATHLVGQHQVGASRVAGQRAAIQSQHGMGTGKQVALRMQGIARPVETLDQEHLAAGMLFQSHFGHLQAQFSRHVHDHVFPDRQVGGVAAVLQLGQPQLAFVQQRDLGAFPAGAGGGVIPQTANRPTGRGRVFQLLDMVDEFSQRVRAPSEFAVDVLADFYGTHPIGRTQLHQIQGGQVALVPGLEAIGTITRWHGVLQHTGPATVFQDGNATALAREPQLHRIQCPGMGRLHVGGFVAQPALAGLKVQLRRQHGVGGTRQPGPDRDFHFLRRWRAN